jgi:hypothetical protein
MSGGVAGLGGGLEPDAGFGRLDRAGYDSRVNAKAQNRHCPHGIRGVEQTRHQPIECVVVEVAVDRNKLGIVLLGKPTRRAG